MVSLVGRGIWLNYFKKPAVVSDQFDFEVNEISKEVGIDFIHPMWTLDDKRIETILPWLTATGASSSVVDINNDGWQDIYLMSSGYQVDSKLYINQGNGKFVDSANEYGVEKINSTVTVRVVFFDADNDGTKEMLQLTNDCPKLYKQAPDKKYYEIDFLKQGDACGPSFGLNIFDYDGDGLLDIVYAGVISTQSIGNFDLPTNLVLAENGAPTFVIHNLGNLKFKEEWVLERQDMKLFTMAIGVGDLRGEFKQDLWFSTVFHHDQVFLQEKDGYAFDDNSIIPSLSKSGMAAEIGYLDHRNIPYMFVTHVYKYGYAPHGNSLYHYEGGKFRDHAARMGVSDCGWAWGAKFLDINNDGELELYVANGMFALAGKDSKKEFWFKYTTINASNPFIVQYLPWRPNMKGHNFSGYEKDCFYMKSNGKYKNVSSRADLNIDNDNLDGRSVNLIDFMNDGSQGILVSNQKQRPYLYKVTQKNKHHWLGLKLVGTKSNRDAIGTKVLLYRKGEPLLIRENQPYNGFSAQSDERLHFGLGSYSGEVTLEIHWPSGRVQKNIINQLDTYVQILEE